LIRITVRSPEVGSTNRVFADSLGNELLRAYSIAFD
jgi:hypothetical protein